MNKQLVKDAFLKSLPVLVGYLFIGFGFGIVLRDAGYGLFWALAMSLFIYAGSMQFVGISLISAPASLLAAAISTLMINARHLFYSISMLSKYRDCGKFKPYLIFALTDETYALLSTDESHGDNRGLYFFLVSLFNHFYWLLGTALGSVFAASLPFDTRGIDFSMTALFVSAYVEQLRKKKERRCALLGLGVTLLARLSFGSDNFLIPAMIGIILLLAALKSRFYREEVAK